MKHRRRGSEWMDAPAAEPAELQRSLSFIERINRRLGYTRATLSHLKRMLEGRSLCGRGTQIQGNEPRPQTPKNVAQSAASRPHGVRPSNAISNTPSLVPITILDIATGAADVPRAILSWAEQARRDIRIVAVDLHPVTLDIARKQSSSFGDRLTFMQADALDLPFAAASFDYVITSMFLHHLDDADVVKVIAAADRIARRGVIIADLLRHRRALAWITLFTLFSNPMVRHDARVSVRQAFSKDEVLHLRDQSGASYLKYFRHFGHRFVLAGCKSR
jgi:ubiquinone/menaquinone biosynthesis C-methylase UbiE